MTHRVNLKTSTRQNVLHYLSEKFHIPFTCNYFATSLGKGVVDGDAVIGPADFTEVCKTNLYFVITHLMIAKELQKV